MTRPRKITPGEMREIGCRAEACLPCPPRIASPTLAPVFRLQHVVEPPIGWLRSVGLKRQRLSRSDARACVKFADLSRRISRSPGISCLSRTSGRYVVHRTTRSPLAVILPLPFGRVPMMMTLLEMLAACQRGACGRPDAVATLRRTDR